MPSLTILFLEDGESWSSFLRRMEQERGEVLLILSGADEELTRDKDLRAMFLTACQKIGWRVRIATKKQVVIAAARAQGLRVVDRLADLRKLLQDHPSQQEALRLFSPQLWRQQLRSRLQAMGLLSMPKIRIWVLIAVSVILFFYVLFRLLPNAEVRVWPQQSPISQTANIFLVASGAIVDIPPRVRMIELMPVAVTVKKTITFDQVGKEFTGTTARVAMTILNTSTERFSLRGGTRMTNQAGMVFRLQEPVIIDPGEEIVVMAVAADLDLYDEVIGERGNVRAGLKWEFPGLDNTSRRLVYGENREEATGGTTSFRTVLKEKDLEIARKRLEQELLAEAKQIVDEQRTLFNSEHTDRIMEVLYYDELTKIEFKDFILPTQFLGEEVNSVPVEGALTYTVYAYDSRYVLELLSGELLTHVGEGRRILDGSVRLDRLVAHVIDYADDLSWIKLTVDLTGTEEFVLDPLTPIGAHFAKNLRELVSGKSKEESVRIIKNLPEVENVEISIWPPWAGSLPGLPSHISIVPMKNDAQ